ncbi:MAG: methyltransferase [Clostridiales bacterium]
MTYINFVIMVISIFCIYFFYIKSVQPASLEKKIGDCSYKRCKHYRMVASIFMFLTLATFIMYKYYPLPISLLKTFSWSWSTSIKIAVIISIPSIFLFYKGVKDAGSETMSPNKDNKMYAGIYEKIRHPQAVGEYFLWIIISLLLNSPFVLIISLIMLVPWVYMCYAEEKDLVIRYGEPYIEYKNKVGMFFPKSKNS